MTENTIKDTAVTEEAAPKAKKAAAPKKVAAPKAKAEPKAAKAEPKAKKVAAPKAKKPAASKVVAGGTIKITLVKSLIGRLEAHKACARGLGLSKIRQTIEVADTVENRGMITRINYLLKCEG